MTRERLSALAVLPDDVTDPLLWRLAFDVASAHQPDQYGNCRNLQCSDQRGMCVARRTARHAITLARRPSPVVARPALTPDRSRAVGSVQASSRFRGWFAPSGSRSGTVGQVGPAFITAFAA
ncbi:hypothetical protein [Micromonospora globbae]|uniref:hypothetical protein n=1 Tax=Micromonospora globbae TaxID=1894969 RepID=UPI00341C9674